MDEGLELRADVFRPDAGRHPVLLSCGPYGKGLAFQEGYPGQWEAMVREHPEVARGTSNRFQNWEVRRPLLGRRHRAVAALARARRRELTRVPIIDFDKLDKETVTPKYSTAYGEVRPASRSSSARCA
jgi:hypothetical protein